MSELRVPAAGRACGKCGQPMQRAKSGSLRWFCRSCRSLSDVDPYLESVRDGMPMLPGMPIAPESERRWVLTFADMPPSVNARLTLRERMHWRRFWREAVKVSACRAGIPSLPRVRLSAVFYRRSLGVADEDNDRSRLKCVDGLVLAGVIPKDTRRYVEWGEVREERGPTGFALVIEAVS